MDPESPEKNYWFEYLPESKVLYVNFSAVADARDESIDAFFKRVFALAAEKPVEKFVLDIRSNGGGNNGMNAAIIVGAGVIGAALINSQDNVDVGPLSTGVRHL